MTAEKTGSCTGADFAAVFKALGDSLRVRIFHLLIAAGEPLCVCEIVDALDLPQYQVSRHMAVLKKAGLVGVRREGTWVYHFAQRPRFLLPELWTQVCTNFRSAEPLQQDLERLQSRLQLREAGRCVVGLKETCDC